MGDLQCPARLFLARTTGPDQPGGPAAAQAEQQRLRTLARALVEERVLALYTSPRLLTDPAVAAAAEELGLAPTPIGALADAPGQESTGADTRVRQAVEELADLHRGETVLLICPDPLLAALLAGSDGPATATAAGPERGTLVQIDVSSHGWQLRRRG